MAHSAPVVEAGRDTQPLTIWQAARDPIRPSYSNFLDSNRSDYPLPARATTKRGCHKVTSTASIKTALGQVIPIRCILYSDELNPRAGSRRQQARNTHTPKMTVGLRTSCVHFGSMAGTVQCATPGGATRRSRPFHQFASGCERGREFAIGQRLRLEEWENKSRSALLQDCSRLSKKARLGIESVEV